MARHFRRVSINLSAAARSSAIVDVSGLHRNRNGSWALIARARTNVRTEYKQYRFIDFSHNNRMTTICIWFRGDSDNNVETRDAVCPDQIHVTDVSVARGPHGNNIVIAELLTGYSIYYFPYFCTATRCGRKPSSVPFVCGCWPSQNFNWFSPPKMPREYNIIMLLLIPALLNRNVLYHHTIIVRARCD